MSLAELTESLPAPLRKHLDPASPLPGRMMAAKGMVPLAPREMLLVMCGLALDPDEKLASAADASLRQLPDKILGAALETPLPASALALLATTLADREEAIERIVLNKDTPDEALAAIAVQASERVADMIAGNQERCLRSEALVGAIRRNPRLSRSSLDRLFDFLVRAGVFYDGMPEFGAALGRLAPTALQGVAEQMPLPPEATAFVVEPDEAPAPEAAPAAEQAPGPAQDGDRPAAERMPLLKLINNCNVAQKVALALKGNKEARMILVRDTNRVVASAAIRSPRITEPEIVAAAKSRSVNDEVVRIIAGSKDMVRSYGVKLALVNNPKTPVQVSMRLLALLRASDIRAVAKSKNVSTAVANQAKRLLSSKKG